jgi:polar amino acid transport system substrate-binding protein
MITNLIDFISNYGSYFIKGTMNTLLLSMIGVTVGTILGIIISLVRSMNKYIGFIATAYVEYTRGTPLIAQATIIYYLPALIGLDINKFVAGIIAISLNSAAYMAEIIRGGINSVDKGQMEAARSLGMSRSMAMREIILPQAIKNILPSLVNEFIAVIKESSVISVLGVAELMYMQGVVKSITYQPLTPLFIASFIYFILTFSLSKIVGRFERRLKVSD